ncbi:unnamed protein product [Moneuplotes crassus]|uniref:DUF4215 domain-containing protein n=1 Tax=Euplotes crassus TaxID=5936 RepID=A0AAD1U139_EUPCR|nr:unnamed protein product [Moneuplotes crassus]
MYSDINPVLNTGIKMAPMNYNYNYCGNKNRWNPGEQCDDGNWDRGDGCDENCQVESGWSCTTYNPTVCTKLCRWDDAGPPPDQDVDCYDRNQDDGDGCDESCKVESGYTCSWNSTSDKTDCTDKCGDGVIIKTMPSQYCDDGNLNEEDGCSSTCNQEVGYVCTGGSTTAPSVCSEDCGDGRKVGDEACDDGGKADHDGCSSTCTIELGYICTGGSETNPDTCNPICGDGRKFSDEICDDKNTSSGDGCDSTCTSIEDDYQCTGGSLSQPDTCTLICGNGKLPSSLDQTEHCDDGNTQSGDGCDENCKVESGWECTGGSLTSPSICEIECIAEGCVKCESGSDKKCVACEHGYQLVDNKHCRYTVVAEEVQTLSSGSQAAAGAGSLIATLMSLLNSSSPMAIWSMANQMQLLMLLLLTQTSLPADVVGYISGNQMFSFNMNFLPIQNNVVSKVPLDWLKQNQTNIGLGDMGIESGSSFNNNFGIICTLLMLIIFHCLWSLLPRTIDDDDPRDCKEKTLKFVGWVWKILTFGVYIRLVLEAYQNILLSSLNEIKNLESLSIQTIISASIALLFLCITLIIFYLAIKQINLDIEPKQHSKSKEFTAGLKDSKAARVFTTLLLLRRLVFCTWLIIFSFTGYYYLVPGMLLAQILYTVFIIFVRPFKENMNNLIECLNEIFFVLIVAYLMKYNTKKAWTPMATRCYVYLLILNNLLISFIISAIGITQLCYKLCHKNKPPTSTIPQIIPPKISPIRFDSSNIIATSDIHLIKFPTNTSPSIITTSPSPASLNKKMAQAKIRPVFDCS